MEAVATLQLNMARMSIEQDVRLVGPGAGTRAVSHVITHGLPKRSFWVAGKTASLFMNMIKYGCCAAGLRLCRFRDLSHTSILSSELVGVMSRVLRGQRAVQ